MSSSPTEYLNSIEFQHALDVEKLEDRLAAMQDDRDAAILERDKIQGLFDMLNDQNLRLAQRIGRIRAALDEQTVLSVTPKIGERWMDEKTGLVRQWNGTDWI